jgi:hypothetical protein
VVSHPPIRLEVSWWIASEEVNLKIHLMNL